MIKLTLKALCDRSLNPFIVRVGSLEGNDALDAPFIGERGLGLAYSHAGTVFEINGVQPDEVAGDVLLIVPQRQVAHRLLRASSKHNTLLVTEQCDQLCVMCSQPPKPQHEDLFDHFIQAVLLAPRDSVIGVSGGEPMLHKERLFFFLQSALAARSDLKFHILTNGQHFEDEDINWLRRWQRNLLWGIPLYAANAETHDAIVGKQGAHSRLLKSLVIMAKSGSAVELRTVAMKQNSQIMAELSDFISRNLSFISEWAIMQIERIGFGRKNWSASFWDTSVDFAPLAEAIDIAVTRRLNVVLYNFPLCTVPIRYRRYAVKSISDWKQKYLDMCSGCNIVTECGGFFEWYVEKEGFKEVQPQ